MKDLVNTSSADRLAEAVQGVAARSPRLAAIIEEGVRYRAEWPEWALRPTGLVGRVAEWIKTTSRCGQPKFALAGALVTCGHFIGRAVKEPSGQWSNIYALALGPTSSGKTDALKLIGKAVDALGHTPRMLGKIQFQAGLEDAVADYPHRLALWDEVGKQFKAMKGAEDSGNPVGMTGLTEFWSSAGRLHKCRQRARNQQGKFAEAKTIKAPFVSVYATSNPGDVLNNITTGDLADGSFPRWLVFLCQETLEDEERDEEDFPPSLLNDFLNVKDRLEIPAFNYDKPAPVEAKILPVTDGAAAIFAAFKRVKTATLRMMDGDERQGLVGKIVENAKRVALIVAACRARGGAGMIDAEDAEFGCALSWLCFSDFMSCVQETVADNEQARLALRLKCIIKNAGPQGITKNQLHVATHRTMSGQDRYHALLDLVGSGVVTEVKKGKGKGQGKGATRYFYNFGEGEDA